MITSEDPLPRPPVLYTTNLAPVVGGCAAVCNPGGTIKFDIIDASDVNLDDVNIDGDNVTPAAGSSNKFEDAMQLMHIALAGHNHSVRNTVREIT